MSSWVSSLLAPLKGSPRDRVEARDPIRLVQVAMMDPKSVGPAAFVTALDEIVVLRLWQNI